MYSTPTLATRFARNTFVVRSETPLAEDQMRGWRQLPWPVDDNYLGRLKACAGRVLEARLP